MNRILVAFFVAMGLQTASASAQNVTYGGCRDFKGMAVVSVKSNVNNVAIAGLDHYQRPVIWWNPYVLSSFHPVTRFFWYMHECAHHKLGHSFGSAHPFVREKHADCWAIRKMKKMGKLNPYILKAILEDISKLPGDGYTYLPGPQRAVFIGHVAKTSHCPI